MKEVTWVGDSREKLRRLPKGARKTIGEALTYAQFGEKHPTAKPMRGIGTGVMEIVARQSRDTYRAVYVVNLGMQIYVLHVFQKKATRGIKTPKREIDLIKHRLRQAKEMEATHV